MTKEETILAKKPTPTMSMTVMSMEKRLRKHTGGRGRNTRKKRKQFRIERGNFTCLIDSEYMSKYDDVRSGEMSSHPYPQERIPMSVRMSCLTLAEWWTLHMLKSVTYQLATGIKAYFQDMAMFYLLPLSYLPVVCTKRHPECTYFN